MGQAFMAESGARHLTHIPTSAARSTMGSVGNLSDMPPRGCFRLSRVRIRLSASAGRGAIHSARILRLMVHCSAVRDHESLAVFEQIQGLGGMTITTAFMNLGDQGGMLSPPPCGALCP